MGIGMIKAKSVECFELFADDKSLGLYKVESRWNGLVKLCEIDGKREIIASDIKDDPFDTICGNSIKDLNIIMASAELHKHAYEK